MSESNMSEPNMSEPNMSGAIMSDFVLTENHGRVRLLTLNRPEKKNAINNEMRDVIRNAFEAAPAAQQLGPQRVACQRRGRRDGGHR